MNLPFWFEVSVMALNAAFGAAVARSRVTPIFGTLLAGLLVGLGGSVVRDLLLLQEPVAISNPVFIPACLISGVIGALLFGRIVKMPGPVRLLHGFVLGTLVTIGAQQALVLGAPVISAICLGVVTATFGAVAADIITGRGALLAKPSYWLAGALTCGSVVFVVVSLTIGKWPAVLASIAVSTGLSYGSSRGWPTPRWPGESRQASDVHGLGDDQA